MRNTIIRLSSFIAAASLAAACNFLDPNPKTDLYGKAPYDSEASLEAGIYGVLRGFTGDAMITGNMQEFLMDCSGLVHWGYASATPFQDANEKWTCALNFTQYSLHTYNIGQYNGFYLAAQKLPDGEYRSFGLERVVGIPSAFDYDGVLPERYNYEELFNDPFGPFGHDKEINAVLKFDSFHGFYNLEKNWPDAVKIEVQPDESVIMRARTHSYSGIRKYVLGFGTGVEVLEPEWFRNAIRDWHQKAADMYKPAESVEVPAEESEKN